jgi:predicted polyphosphate/ATP-dependent NAD kinase
MKRLGLIVNPIAGLGGRVGLKGSDGVEVQQKARALGAEPMAQLRAAQALSKLLAISSRVELLTPPGEMGEDIARQSGFSPHVLGSLPPGPTSSADTFRFAQEMLALPVDLILFAGGDGTACDMYRAVGEALPVLGIPAGVKIHSAVFATHPPLAGELAASFLQGKSTRLEEAEVLDLDEQAYRSGTVITRLYGYLKVPYRKGLLQNKKAPTPAAESAQAEAIAADVIDGMLDGVYYILGPGTTTQAITARLGLGKTLLGVDVITRQRLVAADVSERQLLSLIAGHPARIVVTPIGGQGFVFGRGNQQISPQVIQQVGRENIILVSLQSKLNALRGQPLLVDTGDEQTDQILRGYFAVITGYRERVMYLVKNSVNSVGSVNSVVSFKELGTNNGRIEG